MAKLNSIIGAILRDISEARVQSDLFSRDVSKLYESDSLLRVFPIPRTEIKEVNIDLKFSIADVTDNEQLALNKKKAEIMGNFENSSILIARQFVEELKISASPRLLTSDIIPSAPVPEDKMKDFLDVVFSNIEPDYQTYLKNLEQNFRISLTNLFENNYENIIKDMNTASKKDSIEMQLNLIVPIINSYYTNHTKTITNLLMNTKMLVSFRVRIVPSTTKENHIKIINQEMGDVFDKNKNILDSPRETLADVNIHVDAKTLTELPEPTLSTITISSGIKNYTWSQVDQDGDVPYRRLVPE